MALVAGPVTPAFALPQNGTVTQGSAQIIQVAPNRIDIIQSTQRVVIDWQSFNLSAGDIVNFVQANSTFAALNRVLSGGASSIAGQINAAGMVALSNAAGIRFDAGALVNVGSLMATTAGISNADFMAGRYDFNIASNDVAAAIVNAGEIKVAPNGAAILAGARVENAGLIQARAGHVVLAAGKTFAVDLNGDRLLSFAVTTPVDFIPLDANGQPVKSLVENTGQINADGGRVLMTARAAKDVIDNVINTKGIVEARTASLVNGEIVLDGGDTGSVLVAGTLDASGQAAGESGGTVKVLGEKVGLMDQARIDVAGDAGGGTALIGGNYQGRGPEQNASAAYVDAGASINADAIASGNGGKVIVWGNDVNNFNGTISARGGLQGGNGGFVETSAKRLNIGNNASVLAQARAANGAAGTWLLDPDDIDIGASSSGNMSGASPFTSTDTNAATVGYATIETALNAGSNVTVQTTNGGNITMSTGINKTAGASASLTLDAAGNITTGNVSSSANVLNLNLHAAGTITVGGTTSLNGGTLTTKGQGGSGYSGALSIASNITAGSLQVSSNGVSQGGGYLTVNGSTIIDGGSGSINLTNASNNISSTLSLTATGGNTIDYSNGSNALTLGTVSFGNATASVSAGSIAANSVINGAGTLRLVSQADISVGGSIAASGGTLNVESRAHSASGGAPGAIVIAPSANISTGGGWLSMGGGTTPLGDSMPTVAANGNSGTGNLNGVYINAGATVTTGGGNFYAYGAGATTASNMSRGFANYGVVNAGGGNISVTGIGGVGAGIGNIGVDLVNGGDLLTSGSGSIAVTGSGNTAAAADGISLYFSTISATGSGTVTLTGTGQYTGSNGVNLTSNSNVLSANGNIVIFGTGVGAGVGVASALCCSFTNNQITSSGGGSITFHADNVNLDTAISIGSSGTVSFVQNTGGIAIDVAAAGSGLVISSALLSNITNYGTLSIGDALSGALTIGGNVAGLTNKNLQFTTAGTLAVNSAVSGLGTGSLMFDSARNVSIGANVTTATGDIVIKGNIASWANPTAASPAAPTYGSTSGSFSGVSIGAGIQVTSSGGNIAIAGKGGDSGADQSGVSMTSTNVAAGTIATTGSGRITIFGEGGASQGGDNFSNGGAHTGIYFNSGGGTNQNFVVSTVNGDIYMNGTGGGNVAYNANNGGVAILWGNVTATGAGNLTMIGQAGQGDSVGVLVYGTGLSAAVSVDSGTLTMTGTGSGGGSAVFSGYGVSIIDSVSISGGIGSTIAINGTGANSGTQQNHGVNIHQSTLTKTGAGTLTVMGTAGTNGTSIRDNLSTITATGTGSITLDGDKSVYVTGNITSAAGDITIYGNAPGGNPNAGTGTGGFIGVGISNSNSNNVTISTTSGDIIIAGKGGDTGLYNHGILIDGAQINAGSTGNISLSGVGGATAAGWNVGTYINGDTVLSGAWSPGASVTSVAGNVSITGVGGGTGTSSNNFGIYVARATVSTTTGNVEFFGTGSVSTGASNYSVAIAGSTISSAGAGNISFDGGTGSNSVVYFGNSPDTAAASVTIGGALAAGDLTFVANSIVNSVTSLISQHSAGTSIISFMTGDPATTIGVNGGTGTLSLPGATISSLASGYGYLQIGDALQTGNIDIGGTFTPGVNTFFTTAGSVSAGNINMGANALHIDQGAGFSQTGTISGSGTVEFLGAGAVVANSANSVSGAVSFTGVSSFAFNNNANLSIGTSDTSGNLSLSASGTIGQTGTLTIGGTTTLSSVGDTNLSNSANDFTGAITANATSGGSVTLVSSTAVTLGNITAPGGISVTSLGQGITLQAASTLDSSAGNSAVYLSAAQNILLNAGSSITSGSGNITLVDGPGNTPGIEINNASITSTGGAILLTGNGGNSGNNLYGVYLHGASTVSTTGTGYISISGTGGTSGGTGNSGVYIDGSTISTQNGNINITAIGAGTSGDGLLVANGANVVSSGTGALSLVAAGAGSGIGIASSGASSSLTSNSGAITFRTDTINMANMAIGTTGALTIKPDSNGGTIGIAGGAGTLQITGTDLANASAGSFSSVTIGDANSGAVTAGATSFGKALTVYGSSITLSGTLTKATGSLSLISTGAVSGDVNLAAGTGTLSVTAGSLALTGTVNGLTGAAAAGAVALTQAGAGPYLANAVDLAPPANNNNAVTQTLIATTPSSVLTPTTTTTTGPASTSFLAFNSFSPITPSNPVVTTSSPTAVVSVLSPPVDLGDGGPPSGGNQQGGNQQGGNQQGGNQQGGNQQGQTARSVVGTPPRPAPASRPTPAPVVVTQPVMQGVNRVVIPPGGGGAAGVPGFTGGYSSFGNSNRW